MKPYTKMGAILRDLDRDVVFNLCQYGMGEVWEWGGEVGGHCWRTTGDLGLARNERLPGFYHIGLANARHWQHARPGQWNDPDYILIGWVGSAHAQTVGHETTLTGNEQYSYMSLWCLMAAPLIFSGDMDKLDPFTLNVLCNAEVIQVDQDALGKQARIVHLDEDSELVMAKPLEDGSLAVGLFNLAEHERQVTASWEQLDLQQPQRVRDLWRQQDLGVVRGAISQRVPRHGVALLRLWPQPAE
jgi:alpha-galactosidase